MKMDIGQLKMQVNKQEVQSQQPTKMWNSLKSNKELNDSFEALTAEVRDLQQYTRISNLLITGILAARGDDVNLILDHLACLLKINTYRSAVSVAHRLLAPKEDTHPSIVVSFVSRIVKREDERQKTPRNLVGQRAPSPKPADLPK